MKSVPDTPRDPAFHAAEQRLWLSALADGEADAAHPACALWRDNAEARQAWHAYHLIGDVLRSDDLALAPTRDAAFLAGVRARLAAEPVVLAPTLPQRARQRWLLPASMAAGFMAVAGVLLVARNSAPDAASPGGVLASASSSGSSLAGRQLPSPASAQGLVAEQGLIRNARLDEYLRAHQAARGGTVVVAPGGTLRRADTTLPPAAER